MRANASSRRSRATRVCTTDGAIICIKDLFDVAGEPTRAGSKTLAEEAMPATADAVVVRRLRAAGAVIAAKNNMSKFAFTAFGANPHYGTPGDVCGRFNKIAARTREVSICDGPRSPRLRCSNSSSPRTPLEKARESTACDTVALIAASGT
jgi:hypothetical protein